MKKEVREGYKMTELGEIPNEWEVCRIDDLCKVNSKSLNSKTEPNLVVNYIDIESVSTGKINNIKQMIFSQAPSRARRVVKKNDVIMSTVRPYLKAFVKVKSSLNNLVCSTGFAVLEANEGVNSEFVYQSILSNYFIEQIKNKMVGSNYPAVNSDDVKESKLILPSIQEQEKIAEILSTVDEQIENTEKLIQKNQELKKGLMQQLLTKGIGHIKFKKTELGNIPKEWKIKKIYDLVQYMKSGLSRNLKSDDIGIPCIRSNNIIDNKIDDKDLKYWYLEDDKGANINEYILDDGDVLVNFINSVAQIGKTCIYKDIGRPVIYTTNIFRLKMNQDIILNKYFYYFTQIEKYKKEIMLITKPAVNQASFTAGDFKKIKLIVPPIDEQEKIVLILSVLDEKIEKYQNKKEELEKLKKGLMQKLLTGNIRCV